MGLTISGFIEVLKADTAAPLDVDSFYKVTAVDMLGNESEASNIVSARPGSDTTPPRKTALP